MRSLNDMCRTVYELDPNGMQKLEAVADYVQADSAIKIKNLAANIDLLDFVPDVASATELGQYMIRDSGHFEYDENLDEFYDYRKYGENVIASKGGDFTAYGYVCYNGTLDLDQLLEGDEAQNSNKMEQPSM